MARIEQDVRPTQQPEQAKPAEPQLLGDCPAFQLRALLAEKNPEAWNPHLTGPVELELTQPGPDALRPVELALRLYRQQWYEEHMPDASPEEWHATWKKKFIETRQKINFNKRGNVYKKDFYDKLAQVITQDTRQTSGDESFSFSLTSNDPQELSKAADVIHNRYFANNPESLQRFKYDVVRVIALDTETPEAEQKRRYLNTIKNFGKNFGNDEIVEEIIAAESVDVENEQVKEQLVAATPTEKEIAVLQPIYDAQQLLQNGQTQQTISPDRQTQPPKSATARANQGEPAEAKKESLFKRAGTIFSAARDGMKRGFREGFQRGMQKGRGQAEDDADDQIAHVPSAEELQNNVDATKNAEQAKQELLQQQLLAAREAFSQLHDKGEVDEVLYGTTPIGNPQYYWQQVRFGPELENQRRDADLYRGYLMVNPSDIPISLALLRQLGDERKKNGETLDFKWLQMTIPDPNNFAEYIADDNNIGKYDLAAPDPRIAIYADKSEDIQDILKSLAATPEWQTIEDNRIKANGTHLAHSPRRPGTSSFRYEGREYRTLNWNDETGFSESAATDPLWRYRKQGTHTIPLHTDQVAAR